MPIVSNFPSIKYVKRALSDYTWKEISEISKSGMAKNYFNIGDCKPVHINGQIGEEFTWDITVFAFILGFDHNSMSEGSGIRFCLGKQQSTNTVMAGLYKYNKTSYPVSGKIQYNMFHWFDYTDDSTFNAQYGWYGTDFRYDILGSTDVPPTGYGTVVHSPHTGYNATINTTTNPVNNTYMSALPEDLRMYMKPITVISAYYNNSGTKYSSFSVDYLPLLSYFEMSGASATTAITDSRESQFEYFKLGNIYQVETLPQSGSASNIVWLRNIYMFGGSRPSNNIYNYMCALSSGSLDGRTCYTVEGILPMFMI